MRITDWSSSTTDSSNSASHTNLSRPTCFEIRTFGEYGVRQKAYYNGRVLVYLISMTWKDASSLATKVRNRDFNQDSLARAEILKSPASNIYNHVAKQREHHVFLIYTYKIQQYMRCPNMAYWWLRSQRFWGCNNHLQSIWLLFSFRFKSNVGYLQVFHKSLIILSETQIPPLNSMTFEMFRYWTWEWATCFYSIIS